MYNNKRYSPISTIMALVIFTLVVIFLFMTIRNYYRYRGDEVIATSNGRKIYKSEINKRFVEILMLQGIDNDIDPGYDYVSQMDRETLQQVVKEAEISKVLVKQAKKANIYRDKTFINHVNGYKDNLAIDMFSKKKAQEMVTDEKIRARYNSIVDYIGDKEEIKVQHILLSTKQAANSAKRELRWRKFEDVAFQRSLDKSSADVGGDLGYVMYENLNKDFADAAFALQVGEVSNPVQTEYGWHVIKVLDRRKVEIYSFEEVKEQIRKQLLKEATSYYLENIANDIDVKILYNRISNRENADQIKNMLNAPTMELQPLPPMEKTVLRDDIAGNNGIVDITKPVEETVPMEKAVEN